MSLNLADILVKGAERFPEKIALEDLRGHALTYSELKRRAEKLAALLTRNEIKPGSRIGLLTSKSVESVAAILGILRSGSAYVPLDHKAPLARNLSIIADCSLQALVIEKSLIAALEANGLGREKYRAVDLEKEHAILFFTGRKERHKEDLAYILYTSGSTGVPKGVKHTHASARTFVNWAATTFSVLPSDRVASHAPFHFDLSVFDLFVSLKCCATLVLIDERTASNPMALAEMLSRRRISALYTTPSVLSYLATFGKMYKYSYDSLRMILFAGEVFPPNNLKTLKSILPKPKYYNLYGPTETNVCTWFSLPVQVPQHRRDPFPIGKTCIYADHAIVKQPGHRNGEGELWISGDSLMNGYWNDNEKTDSNFETDINGVLWYRTGDVVSLNNDGDLQYLRRADRMVKRNSYRIELDEIEKHLARNSNILEAAVTSGSGNSQTGTVITAHIAWHREKELATTELVAYCASLMPVWMIPDKFEYYDSLPKTSTDKINYVALTKL